MKESASFNQQEMVRLIVEAYQKQQLRLQKEQKDTKAVKRNYSRWDVHFKQLLEFKLIHRHCLVPHTYPPNQALAKWAKKQRYEYKLFVKQQQEVESRGFSKIATSMNESRIEMLNEVGFIWDSHTAKWEQMFRELLIYKKEHGHCLVPAKYASKGLGNWVARQRLLGHSAKSNSSHEKLFRIKMLDSIGFSWGCPYNKSKRKRKAP